MAEIPVICDLMYEEHAGDLDVNWVRVQLFQFRQPTAAPVKLGVDASHYMLRKQVVVDGEDVMDTYKAYHPYPYGNESTLTRLAISEFDQLLACHPTLGEKAEVDENGREITNEDSANYIVEHDPALAQWVSTLWLKKNGYGKALKGRRSKVKGHWGRE